MGMAEAGQHKMTNPPDTLATPAGQNSVAILEPDLVLIRGHHFQQTLTFARCLVDQGKRPIILCGRLRPRQLRAEFEQLGAVVHEAFRCHHLKLLRARDLVWSTSAVCQALTFKRLAASIPPGCPVIAPSGSLRMLLGLSLAIRRGWWPHVTRVQLFTWDRRQNDQAISLFPGKLLALTEASVRACPPGNPLLFGWSHSIADLITSKVQRPVQQAAQAVEWAPPSIGPRSLEDPAIGYLGELRPEKGCYQFLDALPLLRSRPRLLVQAARSSAMTEQSRRMLVTRVEEFGGRIFQESMSMSDYWDLLGMVDIMVCPYDPIRYGHRTSGIVIDALGAGAVPVVPAGTWLAEISAKYDVGLRYSPYTPKALAAALDEVVNNWAEHRDRSRRAAESAREDHAPAAVIQSLLGAAPP